MPQKEKLYMILAVVVFILIFTSLVVESTIPHYPEFTVSANDSAPTTMKNYAFRCNSSLFTPSVLRYQTNKSYLTISEKGYKNTTICSYVTGASCADACWPGYVFGAVGFLSCIHIKGELPSNIKPQKITAMDNITLKGSAFHFFNTCLPHTSCYYCLEMYVRSTMGSGSDFHNITDGHEGYNANSIHGKDNCVVTGEKTDESYSKSVGLWEYICNKATGSEKYFNFSEVLGISSHIPIRYINCTAPLESVDTVTIQGGMKGNLELQNVFDLQGMIYDEKYR